MLKEKLHIIFILLIDLQPDFGVYDSSSSFSHTQKLYFFEFHPTLIPKYLDEIFIMWQFNMFKNIPNSVIFTINK